MTRCLSCRLVVALLTDLQEGALPWKRALPVRLHLLTCRACRHLHRDLRTLAERLALVRAPEPLAPPPLAFGPQPPAGSGPAPRRPWPASPVPLPLERALARPDPSPALDRMARVHAALAGQRRRRDPGPQLSPWLLTLLPPAKTWAWRRRRRGARLALLQADPEGIRLMLGWAPADTRLERPGGPTGGSWLILQGAAGRPEAPYGPGDWVAATPGGRPPGALAPGCWYLLEEGRTEDPGSELQACI